MQIMSSLSAILVATAVVVGPSQVCAQSISSHGTFEFGPCSTFASPRGTTQ